MYPAAAAVAAAVVLADSAPCRSSYTCEPLSAPLVTGSQHLRRCNVASHNKMWWATLDRKCWHAYFSLPPSVRIKQDFFFIFPSEVSLLCFLYSSVRFLIFKLIQLWLRSWLLPTQVPEQMLATVRFCKTTELLKLSFFSLFIVKLFSLGFNFLISSCDDTVRVFCLGLGTKTTWLGWGKDHF